MVASLTLPALLDGETAESLHGRVDTAMRNAGHAIRSGTPEAAIVRTLSFMVYDELWVNGIRMWFDMWVESALGDALDRHGQHYNLPRLEATKATVDITFEGVDGTIIPTDTIVTTAAQVGIPAVSFRTTTGGTIGEITSGELMLGAEAVDAGSRGNVLAGALRFLASSIAGVTNVYNVEEAIGGSDRELDGQRYVREHYRGRLLDRAAEDEGMANIDDYERIIDTIPGVGFRLVEPHWDGYGTIRVIILDSDGNIPSVSLVETVQEYLDPLLDPGEGEGQASIAHTLTVVAPTELAFTIDVPDLEVMQGWTLVQARTNLEAAATEYIASVVPGGIIIVRDLQAVMIQASGVNNIGTILIDGLHADLDLSTTERALIAEFLYDGIGGS